MAIIALYGGTFNPIHNGHLALAAQVSDTLHCGQVRFIPAALPPHKEAPAVSAMHRAAMVECAIANRADWVLDRCELSRSGPSYSIDTLLTLRAQFPQASLCLLMGQDSYAQLPSWHRWTELLAYAHLVVIHRADFSAQLNLHAAHQGLQVALSDAPQAFASQSHGLLSYLPISPPAISSTALRQWLAEDADVRHQSQQGKADAGATRIDLSATLPAPVLAYIRQHQLYGARAAAV